MTQLNIATRTEADYDRAAADYFQTLPVDHFMEAVPQSTQRKIALESLDVLKARRPDVHVYNELLLQYSSGEGLGRVVPDNMVVLSDKPIRAKGGFNYPFESARPLWVLEWVSANSEGKDYDECFQKYERDLKIPYCLQFNPDDQDLRLYRHGGRRYRKVKKNAAGRYGIPELEIELGIHAGWIRFWYRGELLPLPGELLGELDAATKKVEQERSRRKAAEAEVERLRKLVDERRTS